MTTQGSVKKEANVRAVGEQEKCSSKGRGMDSTKENGTARHTSTRKMQHQGSRG